MTQISKTEMQLEGIRELTNEEIAAVAGGFTSNGNLLSCIAQEIKTIICKIERFLSCFGNKSEF